MKEGADGKKTPGRRGGGNGGFRRGKKTVCVSKKFLRGSAFLQQERRG